MAVSGAEIANAYVALTVKAPGIKKDIEQSIGGASSGVEKSGRTLGSSLMKGMKVTALAGAAAVGGAVVGTIGGALTKGFQRLKGIDNATAKMKGLGFSAEETQGLMDNALESVKGTAFGLEDAAGVAAQMAAGGIGPGKEMADVLSTVANSAAAAGGDLSDMGSIFSKALTQANGVQNDVIGQLADKGIPIYQALADQLGVTAGEVFKMASEGKISFEQFAAAAKDAAGGVAEAMGETASGSWANLMASLGRVGAGLLGGVFEGLAPALQGITDAMGPLEDVAAGVGESIGAFLAPGLEFLANLGTSGIDFSAFAQLASLLSPINLAFQALAPSLPLIVDTFNQLATVVGGALSQVLSALMPIVIELVAQFIGLVGAVLPVLLPLIQSVADVFAQVLLALMPLMPPLVELVQAVFPLLAEVIAALMPVIQGVVGAIGTLLLPIVESIVDVLGGVITFLTGVFTGDWSKAWEGLVQIFSGIWNGMVGIVEGTINALVDLINGLIGGVNNITGKVGIPEIPLIPHANLSAVKLAEGGLVQRTQGGTLAVIGEGRYDEAVVPLSPDVLAQLRGGAGQGGVQVDVHPAPGMDEAAIGRIAGREVSYALRG